MNTQAKQIRWRAPMAATFSTALLFLTTPVAAQTLEAHYPLINDLQDATANYGDVTLTGAPPPAPPANGVCHNGIYHFGGPSGQDIRIPTITTLDTTDFQIDVEFKLDSIGRDPILMGGNGWRWIGIYTQPSGEIGVKYNNSNHKWSSTTLNLNQWYSAVLRFEAGTVQLFLDGVKVLEEVIGVLDAGPGNKNFTTNDYSNGGALHGCIRNVRFWNDTCLTCGLFTRFGNGCGGLQLKESGSPNLGAMVNLDVSGTTGGSGILYGVTHTNFQLCAQNPCVLGVDPIDMLPGPSQVLPIPNAAAFLGVTVFFQGISVATTGGCLLLHVSDTVGVTTGR